MTEPRFAPRVDPRRVAALPSVRWLTTMGVLAVFVPGLVLFAVCRVAGMATGPAGLVGLAGMLVGLGLYPVYLHRLGRRVDAALAGREDEAR
ncbi:MAG TPA: hypothetical protein VF288_07075 [Mycobacteriales bacterium]